MKFLLQWMELMFVFPFIQKWTSDDAAILKEGRWDSPAVILLSVGLDYWYPGEKM